MAHSGHLLEKNKYVSYYVSKLDLVMFLNHKYIYMYMAQISTQVSKTNRGNLINSSATDIIYIWVYLNQ